MSYWKKQAEQVAQDVSADHEWVVLYLSYLESNEPDEHARLSKSGELEAYARVHVANALSDLDDLMKQGTNEQSARSIVLADLMPPVDEELDTPEDWEIEGHLEDEASEFGDWIG